MSIDCIEPGVVVGTTVIEQAVAEGGMGAVYRARDVATGEPRAVKVLHAALVATHGAVARFEREARTLLALRHPNVVVCHDSGSLDDGRPYLVMEWLEGRSLAELLADRGALPYVEALPLIEALCAGLQAAHAVGVIHRDIKPSNVVVTRDGAKLVDFGVARCDGEQPLTATGLAIGTPSYMSPEQIRGKPVSGPPERVAG